MTTPAERAAEKIAKKQSAGWDGFCLSEEALEAIIEAEYAAVPHWRPSDEATTQLVEETVKAVSAEYTTERKECVRVMKMAVQNADTDPHYLTIETVKSLRELIGKME